MMSSNFVTKFVVQLRLSFDREKENKNTSKVPIIYNNKNMIETQEIESLVKFNN